jgi:hypothetical protein
MNEKYALDPESIENYRDLKYVVEKFGFTEGRFLLRYPKYWRRILYDHLIEKKVPDNQIKAISEVLEKSMQDFMRSKLEYAQSRTWADNAIRQKFQGNISDVIGSAKESMLDFDDIERSLADSRGVTVQATAENLVLAAEPLLQASEEIFIVDPYLSLGNRSYLEFIKEIIRKTSSQKVSIKMFSRAEEFRCKKCPKQIAEEELSRFLHSTQDIAFTSLNDGNDMHDRYLFSLKGALKYSKGFRVSEKYVEIETVSKTNHQRYVELYIEKQHTFTIEDDFVVRAKK